MLCRKIARVHWRLLLVAPEPQFDECGGLAAILVHELLDKDGQSARSRIGFEPDAELSVEVKPAYPG